MRIWVPAGSELSFYVFSYLLAHICVQEIFVERKKKHDCQHIFVFGHSVCFYVVLNCFQGKLSPSNGKLTFYMTTSMFYNEAIKAWFFELRFLFFKILFTYLFMAVLGLHFCVRAFSSCGKWGPLFIAVRGPLTVAASRCRAQAPDTQAQQLWLTGLVAPRHVGSSQTRAWTRVPCVGRQIFNHCATREAPS